jgi:hypothetical protein
VTTIVGVPGKTTGLGNYLYVNGVDLSGDTNSIAKLYGGPSAQDMTGINKSAYERQAGLRDGGLSWVSYFNPTNAHPLLSALPTADVIGMINFTQAIGAAGAGIVAKQIDYPGGRENNGAFKFSVEAQGNGFGLEFGDQITAGKRSDTVATNGASIDYGATIATTNFGLQLYAQLFSFTGTSVTLKVQSSTDDAAGDAFADVTGATTGALSAIGAARVATGATAAVERYLRLVSTGTFSEATFAVVVCRNRAAPVF